MAATTSQSDARGGRDYGYGNARIRGMKSRLLDAGFYERLMDCDDVQKMITLLSETGYGVDLEQELLHGRTAAQVDEALKDNMVRTFRKVLGFLDGEAAYLMVTLLGRWDLFNVKTIIRGKHLQMASDEILFNLMPAGQLGDVELEALARVQDVRAVVDTLATWGSPYAEPLSQNIVAYMKEGDMAALELAVDRYYADWAGRRLGRRNANYRLAYRILSMQMDIINLMTAMRLQKADVEEIEVRRFFLQGGYSVDEDLFAALSGLSDIDQFLDRLRSTQYGHPLEEAAVRYMEVGTIAVFERALEDFLVRKALGMGVGDPLGVGVIISYLWAKHNEVTNLRIIVKGHAVRMPPERVRRELILV